MKEESNVVAIRNEKGHFVKGQSGNPAGISKKQQAVNSLTREQKAVLQSMFTAQVPKVVRVLTALLVDKETNDDNLIKVCKTILEYGIGKPTQIVATELPQEEEFDLEAYPPHVREAMIKALMARGEADDDL